jgi:hypothetical protein
LRPKLDRALLNLRGDAVGREDHGPFLYVVEAGEPVRLIDQRDALLLQVVGRVSVVDEHAQHVDRAVGLLTDALGDPERVDHAVAVPARGDLEDFHGRLEST